MHRGKAQSPEAVPAMAAAMAATQVGGQPHGRESTTLAPYKARHDFRYTSGEVWGSAQQPWLTLGALPFNMRPLEEWPVGSIASTVVRRS
jgi:hypothetical protein